VSLDTGAINFAGSMRYPELFEWLGWLIAVTAAGLLLLPWRWHHEFGALVMPLVIRHMRLFGVAAAALGAFVLYGVSRGAIS
jgi:hypothetical protein